MVNGFGSAEYEILYNGIDRSIKLLTDILHERKKELSGNEAKLITDSIINLIDEREHFIKCRLKAVKANE